MHELNSDSPIGNLPAFVGSMHLLVVGSGEVSIQKSLDKGATFYPCTDDAGEEVTFVNSPTSNVMFNAQLDNDSNMIKYRLVLLEGQAGYGATK